MSNEILKTVENYYTVKVKEHGATPKGVDWNSKESQYLRFDKLNEVIKPGEHFTILDYGCGTGEMFRYLKMKHKNFTYYGFDLSDEMITIAKNEHTDSNAIFSTEVPTNKFDYVVGSGIFNVRFKYSNNEWNDYIQNTIEEFNQISTKGFSFNALSLFSDVEKRRSDLYYADSTYYFSLCKNKYSRFVSLLHDYNLYEFTILVRKTI